MVHPALRSREIMLLRVVLALSFAVCIWRNKALGPEVGPVSRLHPTLLTPAPAAFSIWSVIYLFLFAFTLRECFTPSIFIPVRQLTWIYRLMIVTNCLNATWIELFTRSYVSAAGYVLDVQYVAVVVIYLIVCQHVDPLPLVATLRDVDGAPPFCASAADYLCLRVPFSLYLSWITGATLINIVVALIDAGVVVTLPVYIGALTLLLLAYLAALLWQGDVVFVVVGIWTLLWLAVRLAGTATDALLAQDPQAYATHAAIHAMVRRPAVRDRLMFFQALLGLSILVSLVVVLVIARLVMSRYRAAGSALTVSANRLAPPPPTYGSALASRESEKQARQHAKTVAAAKRKRHQPEVEELSDDVLAAVSAARKAAAEAAAARAEEEEEAPAPQPKRSNKPATHVRRFGAIHVTTLDAPTPITEALTEEAQSFWNKRMAPGRQRAKVVQPPKERSRRRR
ncbi:Aste57867_898 [Aphanomyces stellatus]|uniref:Aste57867_898 protein n=1 Tax=Aphanomyces stellatus TaxID=120398 RepID=A0A485K518_9STRA|nr:hypothetical protein As57867_000897 [Aphanomyces stellatus]VFT78122.1 Aste57867_898 [Aphanomyces stellatus]